MINNTASRKTLAAVLAVGMAAGLTGCGSTVAANTNDYFTNVSSILHTLQSNGSQQDAASSSTADAGNQLATPTDFTVDENGSYSFTGVEDAEYYLLYFCDPTATGDDDSYIYTSGPINANSSNTYSGNCADEFSYAFGSYLAKVYAFPDLTDKDHSMSKPATAEYSYSGNQSAPELNYYWNTFDGNMSIQVANLGTYEFEAYPDKVDITFTNTENSADVVALTMENVTPDNNQLDTDALTKGATYDVTAVATSNSGYVLNPTSDTTTVATGLLLGDSSLITDAYSYSDGFANNIFAGWVSSMLSSARPPTPPSRSWCRASSQAALRPSSVPSKGPRMTPIWDARIWKRSTTPNRMCWWASPPAAARPMSSALWSTPSPWAV